MHRPKIFGLLLVSHGFLFACQTSEPQGLEGKPLNQLVSEAITSSQEGRLKAVARVIENRHLEAQAQQRILGQINSWSPLFTLSDAETERAAKLYLLLKNTDTAALFTSMVSSTSLKVRLLSWNIAKEHPSPEMAEAIKKELFQRAAKGSHGFVLSPESAAAVQTNELNEAYPLLRHSLFAKPRPAFVTAMADLNPSAAAEDFLDFLNKYAPQVEAGAKIDARTWKSIKHVFLEFEKTPPTISHPHFSCLFHYGLAKDKQVADAAKKVIDRYWNEQEKMVSLMVGQLPEKARRRYEERQSAAAQGQSDLK